MSDLTPVFEELDYRKTPLGEISLRRRSEPKLNNTVLFEVKLGDEFLMSSLFTKAEIELAHLGLAALGGDGDNLDVIIGGLGLGYTAVAALENQNVQSLRVIEIMQPVIDWHYSGLVPLGRELTSDPRCTIVHADFFDIAINHRGFDKTDSIKRVNAVLLDIDHSPAHWLNDGNQSFYTEQGLTRLSEKIYPGGVFGLWSNELPDDAFTALLESVFQSVEAHIVTFPNPYTGGESSNTVYLARTMSN